MQTDDDDDWLEGGEAERKPARSENVTKSKLAQLLDYAPMTIDRFVADGMPVESKGSRKIGWRINLAKAHHWIVRSKIEQETGSPEAGGYEAAKRRDKEEQARARKLANDIKARESIPVQEVVDWCAEKTGILRSRLMSLPTEISGLSPEQRDELTSAIHDMLSGLSGAQLEDWKGDASEDSEEA